MNLTDERKKLALLRENKKNLVIKKENLLKKRFGKYKSILHTIMSLIVFGISFDLFASISPLMVFFTTFGYICVIASIYYHKNKVKAKIIDVDITTIENDIKALHDEIRKQELKNLEEMVSQENFKKQKDSFDKIKQIKDMPLFDRDNIENNICEIETGMKLSLRK